MYVFESKHICILSSYSLFCIWISPTPKSQHPAVSRLHPVIGEHQHAKQIRFTPETKKNTRNIYIYIHICIFNYAFTYVIYVISHSILFQYCNRLDDSMTPVLTTKIRSKMAVVSFFWQLNCSCCCQSAPSCGWDHQPLLLYGVMNIE